MSGFVEEQVAALKKKIGDKKVLCAMSGGGDSAVRIFSKARDPRIRR